MPPIPPDVEAYLKEASFRTRTASEVKFTSNICGNQWDRFIEEWAAKCYMFVLHALGPFQKEPLREIKAIPDGAHVAGVNASFDPESGQICMSPSVVQDRPGTTIEKMTHELMHASLALFPEGDPFYEEGYVDYSVWVIAHAPVWEPYSRGMVEAATFNVECRRDRALRNLADYDRKRWAGGLFCGLMHGPWIVTKLRAKKRENDFRW
jgi:hypothetical protein